MKNLVGQRFGKLMVTRMAGKYRSPSGKSKSLIWECVCDCGNIKTVHTSSLTRRGTTSCGCGRKERAATLMLGKSPKITLPDGIGSLRYLYRSYKYEAGHRGLEFQLSLEQFHSMTKQNCFYCDVVPSKKTKYKHSNGDYFYNGIDRVDNTVGYVEGNCVPCCETCNRAKRTMSVYEFYSWIDRAYHHRHTNRLSASVSYTSGEQLWGDGTAEWYRELTELGISK